jgi:hypothetical protein
MARPKSPPERQAEPRGWRFNKQLLAEFEFECARNSSNPKLVVESLILNWLKLSKTARAQLSEQHVKRFGVYRGEEE